MNLSTNNVIYRKLDLERDLASLRTLLKAIREANHDDEEVSEAELREDLTWAGLDPAVTNWVVVEPNSDTLIGWGRIQKASTDENADLDIQVHPAYRRQGLGSRLLTLLLELACEFSAQAVRSYVDVRDQGARLFVRRYGFEPVSTYTSMQVSASHLFPAPELPEGFVIRSYDQIQHLDLLHKALNRSYEGLWGHLQVSPAEIEAALPFFNQEGTFLLFAPDGAVAGIVRTQMSKALTEKRGVPTGHIDAPGVVPEYRDAGLYLPLLLTAIHWLRPQEPVALEFEAWGEAPDTLTLYRDLGFTVLKEEISYRLEVK